MTVLKSKRTRSRLEVLYNTTRLHDDAVDLVLRSFGVYSRNSPLRHKYDKLVVNDKNREYLDTLIEKYKSDLLESVTSIERNIRSAKSFYPSSKCEYDLRRLYQDEALAQCSTAMTILDEVVRIFDVDINCFKTVVERLTYQESLIKRWKKSDRKRFGNLQ